MDTKGGMGKERGEQKEGTERRGGEETRYCFQLLLDFITEQL